MPLPALSHALGGTTESGGGHSARAAIITPRADPFDCCLRHMAYHEVQISARGGLSRTGEALAHQAVITDLARALAA
jgi:hypothetical protein